MGLPVFAQQDDLKEQGKVVNGEMFDQMTVAIENQTYPNIHSVLVHYKGDLVYEKYFSGNDEAWGSDLGVVKHSENTLHDLRSVTKSILSVCIGIAIQRNYIESVDEKVFSFFPEYNDLNSGYNQKLSIYHLLTMTSGLEWNEDIPYNDPKNSEIAMLMSEDPIRYVFSQPYNEVPGTSWNYNGGTTELLAAILHKASGLNVEEFSVKYLFEPLDIKTWEWVKAPVHNYPVAASGLRMLPEDMMKFGVMLLNDGYYNGNLIVNSEWIDEAFTVHVKRGANSGYGYQFWIDKSPENNNSILVAAIGNGDQRIFIDKQKQLVVVTTAGNYNLWNIRKGSLQLLTDFIYPALQ